MKRGAILSLITFGIIVLFIFQVHALNNSRITEISSGYVMIIEKIEMQPEFIAPGQSGIIKIALKNNVNFDLTDVRVQLSLPDEIKFLNSVSRQKVDKIGAGEIVFLEFDVISRPDATEGMYNATITVDYLSRLNGENPASLTLFKESDNFGILVIKGEPKIFAKIDATTIYKGKDIGEITIMFVNNNLANLKFLTVKLLESEDYKIISADTEYIGDLDSDDFESVDFKLNIETKKKIVPLKVEMSYKDAMNKEYTENIELNFNLLTASELGVKKSNTGPIVIVLILLVGAGYYFYKRYRKKKKKEEKYK